MKNSVNSVSGFTTKKIKSFEASNVSREKLSKMRKISVKAHGFKQSMADDLKSNGFSSKFARSFAGVSIMCGVALGSMYQMDSNNGYLLQSNAMEASYKINLVRLNQDENMNLVGGVDKREEIGKEFEAVMEIGKNLESFEGTYGTVKYVLLDTKNGSVAFTRKVPNSSIDKQNVANLEQHFKNDAAKFDKIETITSYTALAPKDLYEAFSAAYTKRGIDTSSLRKFFGNNETSVSKINGESFLNLKIDSASMTSKDKKILEVAKTYYGNKLFVNGINIDGKKFPVGDNYVSISVEL